MQSPPASPVMRRAGRTGGQRNVGREPNSRSRSKSALLLACSFLTGRGNFKKNLQSAKVRAISARRAGAPARDAGATFRKLPRRSSPAPGRTAGPFAPAWRRTPDRRQSPTVLRSSPEFCSVARSVCILRLGATALRQSAWDESLSGSPRRRVSRIAFCRTDTKDLSRGENSGGPCRSAQAAAQPAVNEGLKRECMPTPE